MNNGQAPRRSRNRQSKNVFTTKSGTDIRLNRSFADRRRAHKDAVARQRAVRLSSLPHGRFKRFVYSLHPRHLAAYWFSREGAMMALKITGVGIIACFLLLVGLFAYFRKDLPKITDINGNDKEGSISYYDRTGQTLLWQDYDAVKRVPVAGDKISSYLKDATVAVEDKNFYSQGAFNVRGIMRAAVHNATDQSGAVEGGSTITQQLVKLSRDWTNDRTITRKIKELILAVELERSYSKQEILTGYLNLAPYGGIEVGAESASMDYFGKHANELTLAQASMLAAIPQSPNDYSPYAKNTFDRQSLIDRQHYILDRMVDQHMVNKQQADEARTVDIVATVLPLKPKYDNIQAPYFVLAAKDELERTYLTKTTLLGGWKIDTSVNLDLQHMAEDLVKKDLPKVTSQGGDTAAFVAEDVKTGEVVASTVGGSDFVNGSFGQLNFAHSEQISPGSTFKPYDYSALIDKSTNVGAGSVLYDSKGKLPGYDNTCDHNPYIKGAAPCPAGTKPALYDYDNQFPGPITLRYAIGGSRNVPAVKSMLTVGVDKTIKVANGLMAKDNAYKCYEPGTDVRTATATDQITCGGSSAIGDGAYVHLDDHVNGIASLARLGSALPQTYIHGITDAKGKPVELKKREAVQAVRPDAAYIVDDMASDPKASYLPAGYYKFHNYNGWKFAIKTGTTNDAYDGLMASWSTQYAAMAWVGYHTRTKAMTGTMEEKTAPIVRGWMMGAHDKLGVKAVNWVAPTGMKTLPSFVITKKVSRLGEVIPSPSTDLYPSWYVQKSTTAGSAAATIDKVSGKLATSCTPDAAKQVVGGGNANSFSVDQFVNGGSAVATASGSDDVHNCNDAKPAVALTIASQKSGSQTSICDSNGCTFTVTVSQGTHPLSSSQFPGKLTVAVNGQTIKTFDVTGGDSTQSFSVDYDPDTTGAATVTANVTDSVLYGAGSTQNVTLQTGQTGSQSTDQTTTTNRNRSRNNDGN